MNRTYLPLLPLSVLAAVVAASACSKARTEETTHVIPPAVTLAPLAEPKAPEAKPVAPAGGEDDKPSAEDLKEFQRRVAK
jgi:hypothetical protein